MKRDWPPKGGAKRALEAQTSLYALTVDEAINRLTEVRRERDEALGREQTLRLLLESVTDVLNRHGYPPGETLAGRIQAHERGAEQQPGEFRSWPCIEQEAMKELKRQRDKALDRAITAEARLGELGRGIEDALTEEACREREACATAPVRKLGYGSTSAYVDGWMDALEAKAAAIRARGRE